MLAKVCFHLFRKKKLTKILSEIPLWIFVNFKKSSFAPFKTWRIWIQLDVATNQYLSTAMLKVVVKCCFPKKEWDKQNALALCAKKGIPYIHTKTNRRNVIKKGKKYSFIGQPIVIQNCNIAKVLLHWRIFRTPNS